MHHINSTSINLRLTSDIGVKMYSTSLKILLPVREDCSLSSLWKKMTCRHITETISIHTSHAHSLRWFLVKQCHFLTEDQTLELTAEWFHVSSAVSLGGKHLIMKNGWVAVARLTSLTPVFSCKKLLNPFAKPGMVAYMYVPWICHGSAMA